MLLFDGRGFEVRKRDHGVTLSHNGSEVERCELGHLDRLELGGVEMEFRVLDDARSGDASSFRRLHAFSERLLETDDLDELFRELVDAIIDVIEANLGVLILIDESGRREIAVARRDDGSDVDDPMEIASESVLQRVQETREPLFTPNAADHGELSMSESIMLLDIRSVMCVPLQAGEDLVGLLYVSSQGIQRVFTEDKLAVLMAFAAQAALLLRNALTVTALRASEARYRSLLEEAPDAIVVEGEEGIVFANEQAAELLGLTVEALGGRRLTALLEIDESDLADGARLEATYRGGDTARHLEIYHSRIASSDEGPMQRQFIIRETTERRRLFARMAEMDRMASTGMMAASLIHEIKNPLNYIQGNLEMALEDLEGDGPPPLDDLHRSLTDAREGVDRLHELVEDLGRFSRRPGDRLHRVTLSDIVASAIKIARPNIGADIELEIDESYHGAVLGDVSALSQVVLNLIVNAAQALDERRAGGEGDAGGERRITVRTRERSEYAVIAVLDTGPGIPDADLAMIFEPFFTTKAPGEGTGLGLYICKNLVERFDGRLTVASREGVGTTFRVLLPLPGDEDALRTR
jgi:PAS domain S-box-containing protein